MEALVNTQMLTVLEEVKADEGNRLGEQVYHIVVCRTTHKSLARIHSNIVILNFNVLCTSMENRILGYV